MCVCSCKVFSYSLVFIFRIFHNYFDIHLKSKKSLPGKLELKKRALRNVRKCLHRIILISGLQFAFVLESLIYHYIHMYGTDILVQTDHNES